MPAYIGVAPSSTHKGVFAVNEDPPILMKSSPHAHSHGVRSITFVLALSIHSVIEGIALGVGVSSSPFYLFFLRLCSQ